VLQVATETHSSPGDEYLGGDTAKPDSDPRDTCFGHGTHVAGIIGASGPNEFNMTGVAPEATIYAYRVFSCYGYSDSVIYYQALARAYEDGADVISMSFGYSGPWSSDEFSVITSRLAERGIVLTVSAGNDGNSGPLMVNRPAVGKEVIAVGSVQKCVWSWGNASSGPFLIGDCVQHSHTVAEDAHECAIRSNGMQSLSVNGESTDAVPALHRLQLRYQLWHAPYQREQDQTSCLHLRRWVRQVLIQTSVINNNLTSDVDNAFLCDGKPPAGTPDLSQYAVLVRFPTDCGFVSRVSGLFNALLTHSFTAAHLNFVERDKLDPALDVGVR